ncbi:MAG: iron-sulfur cluster assembly accessory protein [Anaerolineales bacterium]|nr:iron-sulfur cluster assembly accessory protein [Anaerolineales bacterium]NOR83927.1 iron-sulfur cluster assembly accessory protein [Ardenticatenales bacterium]
MTTTVEKSNTITISSLAVENARKMMEERELSGHCLRVYVAGVGCAGPQFGLAIDKAPQENDTVVESDGLRILVDPNSLAYLDGASIEYADTPQGSGFRISNPNLAGSACGSCGGGCG